MRIIFILGTNFLRTQWIVVLVMLAYVIGINSFLVWNVQRDEVLVFLRIQGIYAISFVLLTAIPAIHSERKSRRILTVLSKGIERWQYLGGLLCGCMMISALFCLLVGLAAFWGTFRAGMASTGLLELMLLVFLACGLAASAGLFCSTFLHPMLATGVAAALLALPALGLTYGWRLSPLLFPVAEVARRVTDFRFNPPATGYWNVAAATVAQTLVFWAAGAVAFARRDVTTSSE
jgi:ABC-type transport system involved in multi-copper enzyme maturation permease subunit